MSALGLSIICKIFFTLLIIIPKGSPICKIGSFCIPNLINGCCQPMIIPFNHSNAVEGPRCCSPIAYNKRSQICCFGEVYSTQGVSSPACCGPYIYSQKSSICCQGVLHPIRGLIKPDCCGTSVYDAKNAICCNRVLHSTKGYSMPKCCGYVLIDGRFQKCCIGYMCPL